ncbi:MAG: hypothetical protein ACRC0L_00465, partial [Angustibacter sp.]
SLRQIGSDVMGVDTTVGSVLDAITYGAADHRSAVDPGAVAFALSWREVARVCGESLGVICNNLGDYTLDVQAIDLENSPYSI